MVRQIIRRPVGVAAIHAVLTNPTYVGRHHFKPQSRAIATGRPWSPRRHGASDVRQALLDAATSSQNERNASTLADGKRRVDFERQDAEQRTGTVTFETVLRELIAKP